MATPSAAPLGIEPDERTPSGPVRDRCEVLVVGGGPAGAACAEILVAAGLDVLVLDRATFPRDKVCAGWITPQVMQTAGVDAAAYRQGRTLQPISSFRTSLIGRTNEVLVEYGEVVSYGIRRCEFDEYLLRRSGARLRLGEAVTTFVRERGRWIVNRAIEAKTLVGAGGHFCPVARGLNRDAPTTPIVVAQEAEFRDDAIAWTCRAEPGVPEFYFWPDLKGYGWCFRKQDYVNVGIGRIGERALSAATAAFMAFLQGRGRVAGERPPRWKGHAYRLSRPRHGAIGAPGVLLVGDAAGLAFPESGEGIRPAIESGVLAAQTILDSHGLVTEASLNEFERRLLERFPLEDAAWYDGRLKERAARMLAPRLLALPAFVRGVVLDRWFLHRHQAALETLPSTRQTAASIRGS